MSAPSNHTDHLWDGDGICRVHGEYCSMAPTEPPTVRLGPDGTPLVDDPIETAERLARLADELAALADQMTGVLAWQDAALAMVHPAVDDTEGRRFLSEARRVNARLATSLTLLRDSLGEAHVTADVLADQLHHLFGQPDVGTSAVRGAVA